MKPNFLKDPEGKILIYRDIISCNTSVINALLALVIFFLSLLTAFAVLILRLTIIELTRKIMLKRKWYL